MQEILTWTEGDAEALLAVLQGVVLVQLADGAHPREVADVSLELIQWPEESNASVIQLNETIPTETHNN